MENDEKKLDEAVDYTEREAPKEPNAHEAHQGKFNLGKNKLIAICASALAVVAITVGIIIATTGHTEIIDAAVDATCIQTGLIEGKHCSVCGEVLIAQTVVDALGHDYDSNGACTRCGEKLVFAAGLYDANDNLVVSWDTLVNTYGMDVSINYTDSIYYSFNRYNATASSPYYVLTNNSELSSGVKLVINNDVTKIGEMAFYRCTSLTSITIPDSVTTIGGWAFYGCDSLVFNEYDNAYYLGNESNPYYALIGPKTDDIRSCIIHDGTVLIAENAFSDCDSLIFNEYDNACYLGNESNPYYALIGPKTDDIRSCVIHDGTVLICWGNAFDYCYSITSVTIGNSVTSIGDSAFLGCKSLTSITIPDSVTSIGDYAFYDCDSLTSITIPDSVTSIGGGAFWWCDSLTSITVDENNDNYKSIDGNLYTKDGKTLVQYAAGKTDTSFVIPDSVTSVGGFAFSSCYSLTNVTIPDSVTSIGEGAFSYCYNLPSITIPYSVTYIGGSAFIWCSNLTIYCEAASKPSGWDSDWSNHGPVVWGYTGEE